MFKQTLEVKNVRIPTRINEHRVEYILKKTYKNIQQALELSVPKIHPSGKQKPDKWYDSRLWNMRKALNLLKNRCNRKKIPEKYTNVSRQNV